ncbi:MAG: hypothetical protein P4M15_14645 [Alphaproteobacteria bacterium]|nr:hypothetical protein [Alphaproteobacteria bacterium]
MPDFDDHFDAIPKHRRVALERLFKECAALYTIQRAISPQELGWLFDAIYDRESKIAAQAPALFLGRNKLPAAYAADWTAAFLDTVMLYRNKAPTYPSILALYEDFKRILPKKPVPRITKPMSLGDKLAYWMEKGLSAEVLGKIEAHIQIQRLTQIYFGRYSYERRFGPTQKSATAGNANNPRPDLAAFRRRENFRASLTGDYAELDPAIGLALYLDNLGEETNLAVWKSKTRSLYVRQILLMPGLEKADELFGYIRHRHRGNLSAALKRFTEDATLWLDYTQNGHMEYEEALAESRNKHKLAAMGDATLCILNTTGGYTYAGGTIEEVIALARPPDIYAPGEINFDWGSITEKWRREAEEIAARPKQPPKSQRETKEARVAEAQQRLAKIQAEVEAAQQALSEDEKNEKKRRADTRRLTAGQRASMREISHRTQSEQERRAAEQAAATREENRRSLRREQKRKDAEKAARARQEAEARAAKPAPAAAQPPALTPEEEQMRRARRNQRRHERKAATREKTNAEIAERRAYRQFQRQQKAKRPDESPKPPSGDKPAP